MARKAKLTVEQIDALISAANEVTAGDAESWSEDAWQALNSAVRVLAAMRDREGK